MSELAMRQQYITSMVRNCWNLPQNIAAELKVHTLRCMSYYRFADVLAANQGQVLLEGKLYEVVMHNKHPNGSQRLKSDKKPSGVFLISYRYSEELNLAVALVQERFDSLLYGDGINE